MNRNYLKILIIAAGVLLLWVAIIFAATRPDLEYRFAVRENILRSSDELHFQLWCHSQYSDGSVKKKYIGSFALKGNAPRVFDRMETSLCQVDKGGF